jgi:hypothetical protein
MRLFPITKILILIGAVILASNGWWPAPAEAKPKGRLFGTCTAQQINSSGGRTCMAKAEQREIEKLRQGSYNAWGWVLVCTADGKKACCKSGYRPEGGSGVWGCESVLTAMPPGDRPNTSGGVFEQGPKNRPRRDAISTGGGILEPGPGLGPQGPAATGVPTSGGAAPPPRGGRIN